MACIDFVQNIDDIDLRVVTSSGSGSSRPHSYQLCVHDQDIIEFTFSFVKSTPVIGISDCGKPHNVHDSDTCMPTPCTTLLYSQPRNHASWSPTRTWLGNKKARQHSYTYHCGLPTMSAQILFSRECPETWMLEIKPSMSKPKDTYGKGLGMLSVCESNVPRMRRGGGLGSHITQQRINQPQRSRSRH